MNILITGGSGFIGKALVRHFTREGHLVTVLTRHALSTSNRYLSYRVWDGVEMPPALGMFDVVINLAGAGIADEKWTDARKHEIMQSRVQATRACVAYIRNSPNPPQVFLSASGVGYYGISQPGLLDEQAGTGTDFPAQVCQRWEAEAREAPCRTVLMRIGVVLGKGGGALSKMLPFYRMMIGGKYGTGQQGFPWIHLEDLVRAVAFAVETPALQGPVNFVAPEDVTQAVFSRTLADRLGVPDFFTLPKFMLDLVFGEQSLLFWGGQHVTPAQLTATGFAWTYPTLRSALKTAI